MSSAPQDPTSQDSTAVSQSSAPEYDFIKILGKGGMAEVFLAHKLAPGGSYKEIAFKRILPHVMHEPARVARFLDEIALAAALVHPHIAGISHWGVYRGDHFIEMEYIKGVTLKQLIGLEEDRPIEPLKPVEVALIGAMMADALHYAHHFERGQIRGVVHRDISPDNLMLTLEARAKVLDFGIAKALKGSERVASETQSAAGKPLYHPPEQWQGKGITARTDLYAIGTTLNVALTGRQLFETGPSETFESLIYRVFQGDKPSVADLAPPGTPPALVELIEHLVQSAPDDRPESAQVVSRAFNAIVLQLTGGDPYPAREALSKRICKCYDDHGGPPDTEQKLTAISFTQDIPSSSTRRPVDPSTRLERPAPANAPTSGSTPHMAATAELPQQADPVSPPQTPSRSPLLLAILAALVLVIFALVAGVGGFMYGDFGTDEAAAAAREPAAPPPQPSTETSTATQPSTPAADEPSVVAPTDPSPDPTPEDTEETAQAASDAPETASEPEGTTAGAPGSSEPRERRRGRQNAAQTPRVRPLGGGTSTTTRNPSRRSLDEAVYGF